MNSLKKLNLPTLSFKSLVILLQITIAISIFHLPKIAQAEKETKILILGDSLTEGYGVAKTDAYPNQLEKLLLEKKKKVRVINAGSSGSTSASALGRLKWHMRSKPQIVIFALGANDGLRGIQSKATFENLEKAVLLAQKNQIKVVIAGMKMPMNYGEKFRLEFEQTFVKISKKYRTIFIPFLLKDVGGDPAMNLPDGIHPNEKGHKKMAQNLLPLILEQLK